MKSLFRKIAAPWRRLAVRAARTPTAAPFIHFMVTHMSFAIPSIRLHETDTLVAFYHPQPAYPLHVLLVPKRKIASLVDLQPSDSRFLADVFATTARLVKDLGLEQAGYRLVVNGGSYQDVPHLHFHLISDKT